MKSIICFFILISFSAFCQQEKTSYFQQEVNYDINVKLNDFTHELEAEETIEYINNSPNKLSYIYFHLWPNAYKKYNTDLGTQLLENGELKFYHADENLRGYINNLNFTAEGEPLSWEYKSDQEDICIVYLSKPLLPGEKINISTPFRVKLPKGIFSRLGHLDQSYQITQWYPKPAVYDKDGWHDMPYLDQGEFYSEYGTFDVKITLPKNYVVGATGDLVNGEQELKWLNELAEKTKNIDTFIESDMSFPESSTTTKTLHYHQKNVHDFAWFADKRYHVLKGEVELPHSKKKVTTWAMFTNKEAHLWKKSITYLNDAIYYYSLWNGDYPYKQVTAVDGALSAGGGMEYPNVTVIGPSHNDFTLETVIMHEVGHNWFYGILGSNERDHPWMDEGLNTFNENRYIETKYPNSTLFGTDTQQNNIAKLFDIDKYSHKATYELGYFYSARLNLDQPIEEKSHYYTPLNYGGIVYGKTGLVFDYLFAYLGKEIFDKCMQTYFNRWKFKHPQPIDIKQIFEEVSGKNLDWFFKDLINTTYKIDYKIAGTKKDTSNPNNIFIKLKNKGKINGPISVSGIKDGKIIHTQWYEPIDKKKFVSFKKNDYDKYRIDAQLDIPEINRKNNTLKSKGICKKVEPLRFQFLGSLENPDKTQLFYTPIVGWNRNDNLMPGIAFYNSVIPSKKFEYVITPLYGIGSENINGYANLLYNIYPNNVFQRIAFGVKTASFSYINYKHYANTKPLEDYALEYYKIAPELYLQLRNTNARSKKRLSLKYRLVNVFEENLTFNLTSNNYEVDLIDYYVNDLSINFLNKHKISPIDVTANIQQHTDFVKLNITANFSFAYKKPKSGFDIRFFVGRYLDNNNANGRFDYNMSGNTDYLYDQIYLARNIQSGFIAQQFYVTDGGFKNLTTNPASNRWLNAINLKSNLPVNFIALYADAGISGSETIDRNGDLIDVVSDPIYNVGAALILIPKMVEIYFPIYMSSDLNQLNYGEKIRFTLNINTLKPFELIKEVNL